MRLFAPILVTAIYLISVSAFAARNGQVIEDQMKVYNAPDLSSHVMTTVPKGTKVRVSNNPSGEFYKIKLQNRDVIGWALFDSMSLEEAPEESMDTGTVGAHRQIASATSKMTPGFRLLGGGGLSLYQAAGVITGFDNVSPGYTVMGEVLLGLSRRWSVGFRADYLFETVLITDSVTSLHFSILFKGLPIMAGLDYALFKTDTFRMNLGAFVGYGLTSVSATQTTAMTSVAVANWGLTELVRAQLFWLLAPAFSLYAEGGYRLMQSPSLVNPSPSSSGGVVLNSSFLVNFSGPVVGGGVCISL